MLYTAEANKYGCLIGLMVHKLALVWVLINAYMYCVLTLISTYGLEEFTAGLHGIVFEQAQCTTCCKLASATRICLETPNLLYSVCVFALAHIGKICIDTYLLHRSVMHATATAHCRGSHHLLGSRDGGRILHLWHLLHPQPWASICVSSGTAIRTVRPTLSPWLVGGVNRLVWMYKHGQFVWRQWFLIVDCITLLVSVFSL